MAHFGFSFLVRELYLTDLVERSVLCRSYVAAVFSDKLCCEKKQYMFLCELPYSKSRKEECERSDSHTMKIHFRSSYKFFMELRLFCQTLLTVIDREENIFSHHCSY